MDIAELYRPPSVDEPVRQAPPVTGPFYVVSRGKLTFLFLLTGGLYSFYWFFENWRRYRAQSGRRVSPFWRTVFSVFFTHRLFRRIDAAAKAKAEVAWNPENMASLYVVLALLGWLLSRLSSSVERLMLDSIVMAFSLATGYPIYVAQRAANVAAGDPEGSSNQAFTAVNYIFMLLGGAFWLLFFVGLTIADS